MSRPVSIVLPSLDSLELLQQNLPPLLAEVEQRGQGDEVIVVDDTGDDVLTGPLAADFGAVKVVARKTNGGFAPALKSGVEAASHELVFSMNTDVRIRPGFLEPLIAALAEDDVAAAVPCVFLDGDERRIESLTELRFVQGMPEVVQPGLSNRASRIPPRAVAIAFAVGGTVLFRREDFLARGGFDPIYEPFYWEDVDLSFFAWRNGERVIYQPESVVEHHHRKTIGSLTSEDVFRAAIEKNRLLFTWKFLDDPDLIRTHVAALYRMAVDAWLRDERDELIWLNLALDQLEQVLDSRKDLGKAKRSFRQTLHDSRLP
jgi:GT2 family glycosyltransferase